MARKTFVPRCLPVLLVLLALLALLVAGSASGQRPPFQEREIEQQYRRILQQLAEGTSPAVVALHLRRMEDVCFDQGWEKSLWDAQEWVTQRLERVCGPDCLLPILRLHQALILELMDTYGFVNDEPNRRASFALNGLEKLEKLHREQDKTPEGAHMRADLNAVFGVGFRDRAMMDNARMRFQTALKDHPGMVEALHLLGSLEEKLGRYREARPLFQQQVENHPEDAVARLRLALLDARTGSERAAAAALLTLIARPGSSPGAAQETWVRRLAYQELAMLKGGASAAGGDRPGARQLLQEGLEEFPDDQPICIALAWFTDDRDVSRKILEDLATDFPVRQESARGHYNNWPSDEVADLVPRLQRTLERTNAQLLQALIDVRGPDMLP